MKKINKEKRKTFSNNDLLGIFEGLDISINFSLLPFIAFHFFKTFEIQLAIILTLCIMCLSFFVRVFVPIFVSNINQIVLLTRKKTFYSLLFLSYLLPTITISNDVFFHINILLLIFGRVIIGIFISVNNSFILNLITNKNNDYNSLKYFLTILLGVFIGLLLTNLANQLFSNLDLNLWAWKILYIPILFFIILFYFIYNYTSFFSVKDNHLDSELNKLVAFKIFLRNIPILIPLMFIFIFCFFNWLPGTVNPENMFFSEIKLAHMIFLFMISVFSSLIFQLIGKFKSYQYFSYFVLFLSITFFFLSKNSSTYSINILHFFISVISAISISLFLYELSSFKDKIHLNLINILSVLGLLFFSVSIFLPVTVYFLIYFIFKYNIMYLIIALIFMISLLSNFYFKRRGI